MVRREGERGERREERGERREESEHASSLQCARKADEVQASTCVHVHNAATQVAAFSHKALNLKP
jgi:hypothetical protein